MQTSGADTVPALFRVGDIGVSSEWRDLTLDWTPLLTSIGVSIYTYLRDLYDQQRSLFPFLNPVGPLKQKIQQVHGKETDWALRGPEYVLAAVGLVQVEAGYGPSPDPDNPQRTRVAYYSIGRLTHPVLDWPMLEHVLDALMIALDPASAHDRDVHKKACAALQSLKQAGFLQNCPPDRLFNEFGAWPRLLLTLVMDQRWNQLFTSLHGDAATRAYRQQARAWAEYAERTIARLMEQNSQIREMVQEAQRQGPHGRGPRGGGAVGGPQTDTPPATDRQPATKATQVTQTASVAAESLLSRQAIQVTPIASATHADRSRGHAAQLVQNDVRKESLAVNQLTLRSRCGENIDQKPFSATPIIDRDDNGTYNGPRDSIDVLYESNILGSEEIPLVEPHLCEGELATKRLDGKFWTEVNFILYGVRKRYPHTAGEKKVAERKFYHQDVVIGVVLAALRAIMPIYRPQSFAEAVQLEAFHQCIQQAQALLPQRAQLKHDGRSWSAFLHAYRTVGITQGLRDVNAADYGMLASLYEQHADACWEVLSRVSHATQPVKLTPSYLKRAVANNERAAATAMLQPATRTAEGLGARTIAPATRIVEDDPRVVLLQGEGIDPRLLSDSMSLAYLQSWIAEANARRSLIKSRVGWLIWGIESGYAPDEHPRLPKLPLYGPGADEAAGASRSSRPAGSRTADRAVAEPRLRTIWQAVLDDLALQLEPTEFATWLKETELQLVDGDDHEAVVSASNVFARERLEQVYLPQIQRVLAAHLGAPFRVSVVISAPVG